MVTAACVSRPGSQPRLPSAQDAPGPGALLVSETRIQVAHLHPLRAPAAQRRKLALACNCSCWKHWRRRPAELTSQPCTTGSAAGGAIRPKPRRWQHLLLCVQGCRGSMAVHAVGTGTVQHARVIHRLRDALFWFSVDAAAPGIKARQPSFLARASARPAEWERPRHPPRQQAPTPAPGLRAGTAQLEAKALAWKAHAAGDGKREAAAEPEDAEAGLKRMRPV